MSLSNLVPIPISSHGWSLSHLLVPSCDYPVKGRGSQGAKGTYWQVVSDSSYDGEEDSLNFTYRWLIAQPVAATTKTTNSSSSHHITVCNQILAKMVVAQQICILQPNVDFSQWMQGYTRRVHSDVLDETSADQNEVEESHEYPIKSYSLQGKTGLTTCLAIESTSHEGLSNRLALVVTVIGIWVPSDSPTRNAQKANDDFQNVWSLLVSDIRGQLVKISPTAGVESCSSSSSSPATRLPKPFLSVNIRNAGSSIVSPIVSGAPGIFSLKAILDEGDSLMELAGIATNCPLLRLQTIKWTSENARLPHNIFDTAALASHHGPSSWSSAGYQDIIKQIFDLLGEASQLANRPKSELNTVARQLINTKMGMAIGMAQGIGYRGALQMKDTSERHWLVPPRLRQPLGIKIILEDSNENTLTNVSSTEDSSFPFVVVPYLPSAVVASTKSKRPPTVGSSQSLLSQWHLQSSGPSFTVWLPRAGALYSSCTEATAPTRETHNLISFPTSSFPSYILKLMSSTERDSWIFFFSVSNSNQSHVAKQERLLSFNRFHDARSVEQYLDVLIDQYNAVVTDKVATSSNGAHTWRIASRDNRQGYLSLKSTQRNEQRHFWVRESSCGAAGYLEYFELLSPSDEEEVVWAASLIEWMRLHQEIWNV